ncbi:MAG: peptidase M2 family protein, partial [Gammaproteobacteria bacterium]|nr:peptidase M2 family protein [Gammaproteobacteria bacterium]
MHHLSVKTLCIVLLSTLALSFSVLTQAKESGKTETAAEFVKRIQEEGQKLAEEIEAAFWVRSTYITKDTAILAAKAGERSLEFESKMVNQAKKFKGTKMDESTARAIELMLRGSSAPAPDDPEARAELAQILTDMQGQYGAGKYCDKDGENCRELQELEAVLADSRDYDELLDVWQGWRTVSPAYRKQYQRFVELANEGAKTFGYSNLGDLWKAGYDMETEAFTVEARRLWEQVKPFYEELHCHVRAKLSEQYGA